jgi:hypothetical protein
MVVKSSVRTNTVPRRRFVQRKGPKTSSPWVQTTFDANSTERGPKGASKCTMLWFYLVFISGLPHHDNARDIWLFWRTMIMFIPSKRGDVVLVLHMILNSSNIQIDNLFISNLILPWLQCFSHFTLHLHITRDQTIHTILSNSGSIAYS